MASIFSKIFKGEIKSQIVYQDDLCGAIIDIQPIAPTHILVIPKKEIASPSTATEQDKSVLGHLLLVAAKIARERGLEEAGYRLVINTGSAAGQTVNHLHVHLLAGRTMSWPPG